MGNWIKYNKGSNPVDVLNEVKTNNVWNLNWEELDKVLSTNDIYFYKDNDDIKLMLYVSGLKVNGVFGYGEKARVEDEYLDELKKELSIFKDNREYMEKVNNHIQVADVYKKYNNDEELDVDDLKVIYQVNKPLEGFTTALDHKLIEIKSERIKEKDIAEIFNVNEEHIAFNQDEVNEDTEVFVGNLSVDNDNIDTISNIKYVIGYIFIDDKKLKSKVHVKSSWGIEVL
jgi:hypothetical protein